MRKTIEINEQNVITLSESCNRADSFIGVGNVDGLYAEFFLLSRFTLDAGYQFTTKNSGMNVRGIISPTGEDFSFKVQRIKKPLTAPLLYSAAEQTRRDMSGIRFNRAVYLPSDVNLRDGLYYLLDWLTLKFDETAKAELSTTVNQPPHIHEMIEKVIGTMDTPGKRRIEGRPGGRYLYQTQR